MESLRMFKSTISLSCFFMLLSYVTILKPIYASKECHFPAIFSFGASNADTGALASAFSWTPPPNGETFFHKPVGRQCDGRLIIDFMATSLGLPFLSAYLNSLGTNFTNGANFASAAATIRPPETVIPVGSFSPFYLDVQYGQFKQFINRSQILKNQGGVYGDLMPEKEYFSEALYTTDIGQNDLTQGFFSGRSIEEVNASVPDIVNSFSTNVKNIYGLGARTFWILNTGPIGCLAFILTNFPPNANQKDSAGCAKPYNEVAQYFNYKLKKAIVQLRKDLPLAAITYVDVYSAKYSLFLEHEKYGFELPLVTCCGLGGEYNFGNGGNCGTTVTVNGSHLFVGACKNPSTRIIWDGVHYTDRANKIVFDKISTGAFSDPPIPLKMACHSSSHKKQND